MEAGRKAGTSSQGDRSICTHVTQDAQRRVVRLRELATHVASK